MTAGAIRTNIKMNGVISGKVEAMAILMQSERDSKARDSREKEKEALKERVRARHQGLMDNVIHVVNTGTRQDFAQMAMESQKVKERSRQPVRIGAMQGISLQIAQKEKGKARQ